MATSGDAGLGRLLDHRDRRDQQGDVMTGPGEWMEDDEDQRGDMGTGHQRWTEEEMIESIQRVARELGLNSMTKDQYEANRRRGRDVSWVRICQVFGYWNEAMEAAGLVPIQSVRHKSTSETAAYKRTWDYGDCVDAVAVAAEHVSPKRLTYDRYHRVYRELTLPDGRPLPSAQTIRNYAGSWREVRKAAGLPA